MVKHYYLTSYLSQKQKARHYVLTPSKTTLRDFWLLQTGTLKLIGI